VLSRHKIQNGIKLKPIKNVTNTNEEISLSTYGNINSSENNMNEEQDEQLENLDKVEKLNKRSAYNFLTYTECANLNLNHTQTNYVNDIQEKKTKMKKKLIDEKITFYDQEDTDMNLFLIFNNILNSFPNENNENDSNIIIDEGHYLTNDYKLRKERHLNNEKVNRILYSNDYDYYDESTANTTDPFLLQSTSDEAYSPNRRNNVNNTSFFKNFISKLHSDKIKENNNKRMNNNFNNDNFVIDEKNKINFFIKKPTILDRVKNIEKLNLITKEKNAKKNNFEAIERVKQVLNT
jgi:hypothetical protein